MTYMAPSAPLTIGGVLDEWLHLFRESFSRCWTLALVVVVTGGALVMLVTPTLPSVNLPVWQNHLQMWSLLNGPQNALAVVIQGLIGLWVTGALFAEQIALTRGQHLTTGEALRTGWRRLPHMLLGFLLLGLIIGAVMIPIFIVAIMAGVMAHAAMLEAASHGAVIAVVIVIALGAVAAVIYLSVRLQLWQAALFSESGGAATALGRSWRLVKGHWWRVTIIMFVAGIVMSILGFVLPWGIGIALGVFATHGVQTADAVRYLRIVQFISQAARLITLPLTTAVSIAIFRDLTLRREGGDLAARAEALSGS